jgi:hypothetical protein
MNKIDYWFLNNALTEIISFNWIAPSDRDVDKLIIDSLTSLKTREVAESLNRLFQNGNLLAISPSELDLVYADSAREYGTNNTLPSRGFIPSYSQIELALKQEENLFYFLTVQGGELWESVSHPKWNQYYFSAGNGHKHILRCHSHKMAEKLLEIQYLVDFGSCYCSPVVETIEWTLFTPWQATYWKKLPLGYEINYKVTSIDVDDIKDDNDVLTEKRIEAEKWVGGTKNWYTNYFYP